LAQAERPVPPALQAAEAAAVREAQQAPRVAAVLPTAARGEAALQDAVVVAGPQPEAEWAGGVARRPEAAAEPGVAEVVQRRAAGPASVAVQLRGAQVAAPDAEEAPLRAAEVAALDAEEVRLREAAAGVPDAGVQRRVARDGAVLLLAAAWVGPPSIPLQGDQPAPSARARSLHARGGLRTAQPSARWWQAARGEDVS
jgi:hypothetical protein